MACWFFLIRAYHEIVNVLCTAIFGKAGILFFDGVRNMLCVEANAVVGEHVELPLKQAGDQAAPTIAAAEDAGQFANLPVTIQVNLVSAMPISHPDRRNACDDIVIVNPTVVRHFGVANVPLASDAW